MPKKKTDIRIPRTVRFWKEEDDWLQREAARQGKTLAMLVREYAREKMTQNLKAK